MIVLEYIKHIFRFYSVVARDSEPSGNAMNGWAILGKPVYQMECDSCNTSYWGRYNPKFQLCGRFKCYLKFKKGHHIKQVC